MEYYNIMNNVILYVIFIIHNIMTYECEYVVYTYIHTYVHLKGQLRLYQLLLDVPFIYFIIHIEIFVMMDETNKQLGRINHSF